MNNSLKNLFLSLTLVVTTAFVHYAVAQQSGPPYRYVFKMQERDGAGNGEYIQQRGQTTGGGDYGIDFMTNHILRMTINSGTGFMKLNALASTSTSTSANDLFHIYSSTAVAPVINFENAGQATYKMGIDGKTFKIAAMDGAFGGTTGSFIANKTQVLSMSDSGNVGIGTISPAFPLDIKVPAPPVNRNILNSQINDGTRRYAIWSGTGWGGNYTGFDGVSVGAYTNHDFGIFTNNSLRIAVTDDGFINLGTSVNNKAGFKVTVSGPTYIGTTNSYTVNQSNLANANLFVEKGVVSEDFKIGQASQWADDVFASTYQRLSLSEVEAYIKAHKHLPLVPSEATVKEEGYSMHQLNTVFLRKIEELTLYSIEQEKKLKEQAKQLEKLESLSASIEILKSELINIKQTNK